MAKLTGPLLSLGARGSIGKAVVASSWRGISTMRQYVIPANPRTTAQQTNRTRFAFLRETWKMLPAGARAPWDEFAKGRPFTGMNAFVGENNRLLVGETDLAMMEASPGAGGGLPPLSVTGATGANAGEVTVTVVAPTQLPDGWTITKAWALAMKEQDPTGILTGAIVEASDATSTYVMTIAGMGAGTVCRVFGWFEYEKDNGKVAYSVSLNDDATADT